MISFQYAFRDEFLVKSVQLEKLKKDKIKNTKEFILWAETKIEELHQWLKTHDFENKQEEIEFFKEIKPSIISKLIFEKEVLRIETNAPGGKIQIRKFYEAELRKIMDILKITISSINITVQVQKYLMNYISQGQAKKIH